MARRRPLLRRYVGSLPTRNPGSQGPVFWFILLLLRRCRQEHLSSGRLLVYAVSHKGRDEVSRISVRNREVRFGLIEKSSDL